MLIFIIKSTLYAGYMTKKNGHPNPYTGQEYKKQFSIHVADTFVTLKQGQGHQTWYHLADPKQGYNNAKFENLA